MLRDVLRIPGISSQAQAFLDAVFDLYENTVNGLLDDGNIVAGAGIQRSKLAATETVQITFQQGQIVDVQLTIPTSAGAPATTPPDGTIVVDTTDSRLYVRSGGAWHYIAFTA